MSSINYNLSFLKVLLEAIIIVMLLFQAELFRGGSCWRIGDANLNVSCIHKERQALVNMKHAFLDYYGRLSSWGTSPDCCNWSGVLCNPQTGHIEKLDLHDDQQGWQPLRGEISPSLMELQNLNYLNLSFNDFNGSQIPKFFGSLAKLRYLDLSYSSFGGKIPFELCKLSNLRVLNLSVNSLVGSIPSLFRNLSSLQKLHLNSNNLAGTIPYQLGNLSSLEILWLGSNDDLKIDDKSLIGIEWLSNLRSLTSLGLSSVLNLNYSHNFLPTIGKLPNLRELWLYNCSLADIVFLSTPPSHLNFSASLVTLDLSYNMLTSSIFSWLFNLSSNLATLSLPHNQLSGPVPDDFGKIMNTLVSLDLSYNELSGTITDIHFENLTKLQLLDASYNSLTFKFSNHWIAPFQLQKLWLYQCKLGPGFPSWLRTQNNLQYLYISHAEINDFVPQWFWLLARGVQYLYIESSNLIGAIPDLSIEFLRSLAISLASNQIEGSIPPFLLKAQYVDISENQISNFFPCSKGISAIVENLKVLNLSSNKLSGKIPDCWDHFKSLAILDLSNNQISGNIPNSIGSLSQVRHLILGNNCLRGELPSLENVTELELLDMGKNDLSGPIPTSWIKENMKSLEILILRNNKLDGNIPLHLCYLTRVRVLDLSLNRFTGPIPSCLNNLVAMAQKYVLNYSMHYINFYMNGIVVSHVFFYWQLSTVWKRTELLYVDRYGLQNLIDLSHNQLVGEMPIGIEQLVELKSLNLSANKLGGRIISELGQLKQLEVLDLSRNLFSGEIPSSLVEISFLSILNLSNNNLSGEIPKGTQMQSFEASSYDGNPYLCGKPLDRLCSSEDPLGTGTQGDQVVDEVSPFLKGFYESLGVGFTTGFWIVFGSLLVIRWRDAYFNFLNNLADSIYVTTMLLVAR